MICSHGLTGNEGVNTDTFTLLVGPSCPETFNKHRVYATLAVGMQLRGHVGKRLGWAGCYPLSHIPDYTTRYSRK